MKYLVLVLSLATSAASLAHADSDAKFLTEGEATQLIGSVQNGDPNVPANILSRTQEGWLVEGDVLSPQDFLENVGHSAADNLRDGWGNGATRERTRGFRCFIPFKATPRGYCWVHGPVRPTPTPWNSCNDKRVACPFPNLFEL